MNRCRIFLIESPDDDSWGWVKYRAMVTVHGFKPIEGVDIPDSDWRRRILAARHSPIRYLRYSFLFEDIPSNTAVHFCRHVHAQPYCSSLRNDRQHEIDGDAARRDTPINMILDVNAEKTREIMQEMCRLAKEATPELEGLLVPMCEWCGGVCREMHPCGRKNHE